MDDIEAGRPAELLLADSPFSSPLFELERTVTAASTAVVHAGDSSSAGEGTAGKKTAHSVVEAAEDRDDRDDRDDRIGTTDKPLSPSTSVHRPSLSRPPTTTSTGAAWDWATDAANPYNWGKGRKWAQIVGYAMLALTTSIGTSIMSPVHADLMAAFGVSSTAAILPLSLYVAALGIGPVFVGGPLSETVGRQPVMVLTPPVALLCTVGAALVPTSSFAAFCALRFLAGFAFAPALAVASGMLTETFRPVERGVPVAVFVLMPFMGPGLGPVIGAFACRKGWRWTLWTLALFTAVSMVLVLALVRETYHPVLKRRRAQALGVVLPASDQRPTLPWTRRTRDFLVVGLLRPLHMMVADAIVGLICLYVGCEFATLFSFFAGVPYVFFVVYGFGREPAGLVFLGIVVGSVLGVATVVLVELLVYRRVLVPRFRAASPPAHPPPEHRLYAAMLGSLGMPAGLFWFGWAAQRAAPWPSPALAIVPFAWGTVCIFISLLQYLSDTYTGAVVASAASANSFARYLLAAAFPLFTLQMYESLGIAWASSLLGFIAVALMPVPWLFFRYGERLRAHSRYT